MKIWCSFDNNIDRWMSAAGNGERWELPIHSVCTAKSADLAASPSSSKKNHLTQIKRRSWHLSSGNRRLQYRPAYRISWTGELWFSSLSTQTTVNDDQIRHGSSLPRFPQLRVLRVSHRCRWRSVLLRQGTVSLANRTPMFRDSVLVFRVEYV